MAYYIKSEEKINRKVGRINGSIRNEESVKKEAIPNRQQEL